MYMKTIRLLGLIGTLAAGSALAERPANLQPLPEPPPAPNQVQSGEAIPLGEPQVNIYQRDNGDIVTEHRLNGHLFAMKITPNSGPPYYIIDADGDGYMEGKFFDNNQSKIIAPQWVIHRW